MFRFSRTLESCERSNGATRSCVVRWPGICGHIYCVILKDIVSLRTPANIIEYLCTRLYDIEENNRRCPNVYRIREERDDPFLVDQYRPLAVSYWYTVFKDTVVWIGQNEKTLFRWMLVDPKESARACFCFADK